MSILSIHDSIKCLIITDIVFFIFLYQRYIYKVDHKRVNEFGFSGEMEQQQKLIKNGASAITEGGEEPPADKKND